MSSPEIDTVSTFRFADLSSRAKQHAIEQYSAPEYNWWESTYEQFKEEGKAKGFEIDDINFSGFYSQGDGASWTGRVDLKVYLTLQQEKAEGIEFTRLTALVGLIEDGDLWRYLGISKSGHYEHEMMMTCDSVDGGYYDADSTLSLSSGPLQGANVQQLMEMYCTEEQLKELEEEVLEAARDYAREIYKALETEYDRLTGEECFAEMAEANDWAFDEEGDMV